MKTKSDLPEYVLQQIRFAEHEITKWLQREYPDLEVKFDITPIEMEKP